MLTDRKDEHLSVVLGKLHKTSGKSTGFEALDFVHCALPEMRLDDVDVTTSFLGKRISAPLLVSSMTGGPKRAASINENLARACEVLKLPFAVGSQRVAIEEGGIGGLNLNLRTLAPSVPILGNFGAAQLNRGFGIQEALKAVEMIDADALYIHLNPLQEAVQPEGDGDWSGLFEKIVAVAEALPVPVAIKEVGSGISASLARRFGEAGIAIIDVAGAGGTNWAAVEAARIEDPDRARLANAFADWGIPTAQAVYGARAACPDATIIASGGIRNGIDIAKAIRCGADLAGQAAALLDAANTSPDLLIRHFETTIQELRVTCFCTGSADLLALKTSELQHRNGL
ncbi:MAG: type 2 isopentenyl-diphosphate Delta-isomerase [Alphaproteobacteria bacterium]|nr:type 2 isopentenyl-diphosphate Delta-isomerase [Alphaproteobacteria bacterium]